MENNDSLLKIKKSYSSAKRQNFAIGHTTVWTEKVNSEEIESGRIVTLFFMYHYTVILPVLIVY